MEEREARRVPPEDSGRYGEVRQRLDEQHCPSAGRIQYPALPGCRRAGRRRHCAASGHRGPGNGIRRRGTGKPHAPARQARPPYCRPDQEEGPEARQGSHPGDARSPARPCGPRTGKRPRPRTDRTLPSPRTDYGPGMAGGILRRVGCWKIQAGTETTPRLALFQQPEPEKNRARNESLVSAPAVRFANRHRRKDHRMALKTVQLARPSGHLRLEKRDHRTGQRETPARRCGPRHCGCGGMPPHDAEDLVAACCEDYEDEMYGFAWELAKPREVVPVKGIVAPWPWRGPELTLCPGWHDRNVLDD